MSSIAIPSVFAADHAQQLIQRPQAGKPVNATDQGDRAAPEPMNRYTRHSAAFAAVISLHLVVLWAIHSGLQTRPHEVIVPVQMLAEVIEAPQPLALTPAMQTPQPKLQPVVRPTPRPVQTPRPVPAPKPASAIAPDPTPVPVAVDPTPMPLTSSTPGAPTASQNTSASPAAAVAAATIPTPAAVVPALRVPVTVELPSSDAQYLQNPKPLYPAISRRLSEQGTVLVQVVVTDKGYAQDAQIKKSSGFFRLDNAALEAISRWRFVPGKRGGVPETMAFTVPITFGLQ